MIPLLAFFIINVALLIVLLAKQRELDQIREEMPKQRKAKVKNKDSDKRFDAAIDKLNQILSENKEYIFPLVDYGKSLINARNQADQDIVSKQPLRYSHWAEKYDLCHDCHGVGGWKDTEGEWHSCDKCLPVWIETLAKRYEKEDRYGD